MHPFIHTLNRWAILCIAVGVCLAGTALPATAADAVTPEGKTLETSAKPVKLAENGKALVPIVISPEASEAVRETAARLQQHLKDMTGATFDIEEKSTPAGITLGTLEQFPDSSLQKALEITGGYDGQEALAIRSGEGVVRLLSGSDMGVSHAAYRFLELLGYRHFFMGPVWEVVPDQPTLTFNLNETTRPAIWSRAFGFTRLRIPADKGDPYRPDVFEQWKRANRIGESLDVSTRHIWHALPDAFKAQGYPFREEFKANPEYFALVDGKRTAPQLCVTNTGLQDLVTRYTQMYFEDKPEAHMVSLDTADQAGWCECEPCTALGEPSVQAFYLANLTAKRLQETNPGKYVGILAYSWHSDPPPFVLESNVFVMLTAGMNASTLSFDELFDLWTAKCKRLGIYEYFSYWEMDYCMMPGKGPHNSLDDLPARIKRYADNNVVALTSESCISFGAHGMGYYIAQKLLWDPDADIESLKEDFCRSAFGPAASVMRRYYERLNLSNNPLQGIAMLRECAIDLQEARQLAKGHPAIEARIDDLRANMIYNHIGMKVDEFKKDDELRRQHALEWFTWSFRTRNNYMTDWLTFRAAVGNHNYHRTLAAQLDEPTWYYRNTKDNPWRNDEPVTVEELERRMTEILSEWGESSDVVAKSFASPAVLVTIEDDRKADRDLAFLNVATLLLASVDGGPLRFELFSEPSPNLERQPAKLWLRDQAGEEIAYHEFPEGKSPVKLEVPSAGVYTVTVKRGGRGWGVTLPADQPAAVLPEREGDTRTQNMTTYFYVPKNTKRIALYGQSGLPVIKDGSGKLVLKEWLQGDVLSFDVPKGTDGQVWSVLGKLRNPWFLNIPTILSSDPSHVFVPREVAEADGLSIMAR